MPASPESERGVLACCLLDSDGITKAIGAGLLPTSFADPRHLQLFATMCDMFAAQLPVELPTVATHLRLSGHLEAVGGYSYLAEVSGSAPTTAQFKYYVDKVLETFTLREVIKLSRAVAESAYEYQGDMAGEVGAKIEKLAGALHERTADRTWGQAVDEAEAITRERMKPVGERQLKGREISWGMPDLDRFFGPVEPGELVVIGGYTSSGKSSLLRQVLWQMACSALPTLIETIEARDAEEAINLAGHISGHRSRARLDELHQKDKDALLAAFPMMKAAPFAVVHTDHSMSAMVSRARAFKRKYGLAAWGADYLQIMEDVKSLKNGEREDMAIGRVTSALKRFSTNEGVATFLLSGLNRDYIKSENGREPKLSDLHGSSSIEKDASRVLLLHIPTEYVLGGTKFTQSMTADSRDQPRFFVKLIQCKGRNQGTASVGLFFKRELKTFEQIAR